jgi:ADP-ribose pyrophosphatase
MQCFIVEVMMDSDEMGKIGNVNLVESNAIDGETEKRLRETVVGRETVADGHIIRYERLEVELPGGARAPRDLIRHPGASAVVPVDENGDVYLVRQHRVAIDKVTLEIPAGKLDAGEPPLACAERELREETGVAAREIREVACIYTTPGFCDEAIHIFLATGLSRGDAAPDDGELVDVVRMPLGRLAEMAMRGEIQDAKTAFGILYAARALKA